jgi:cytidylate kinase
MTFVVAIDGPAAAGKGTIARAIAEKFGFDYLDTGLLYRAVGKRVLETGEAAEDVAISLTPADLHAEGLRTAAVAEAASKVAAIPAVRAALIEFQRDFSKRPAGAVLDGRDIGTVICPDADAKLFVTASAQVRAKRRHLELLESDPSVSFEVVLADVQTRDARDAARDVAPMIAALDAVTLDTSESTIEAAIEAAAKVISSRKTG